MGEFFRKIIIVHKDKEIKLIARVIDKKRDHCIALAIDTQTRKMYLLIDKRGFEN